MMKFMRCAGVLVLAGFAACSQTPPETRLVQQAAEALGGAAAIQGATALVIEGTGIAGNIGQNVLPEDPLQNWEITEYRRSMDLANGRWSMQQVRRPTFPFAPGPVQRQNQGLDGNVAWNVGGPQNAAARVSGMVARDRRVEALHHPLTVVRAALDPTSQIGNFRDQRTQQLLDITTAAGDTVTLTVDGSGRPVSVTSTAYHPNLGDVVIQTTFGDYADAGGLTLPRRLTTTLDDLVQLDLNVSATTVNADVGDLAAPAEVASVAEPPMYPAYEITPQRLFPGVWVLPGSHNSVVLEFADHLKLFEVPLNESRAQAVIAAARALVPGKPLTHVIMSHHHFDHSGGLRAAVAEGLTIVAHRSAERFIDAMVERPHTIIQDALAANPQQARIESVEDELMLRDDSMEIRLYHVQNSVHAGTNLMAFVPREGLLIQADLYGPGFATFPEWDNLLENITARGIKVDRHLPIHGTLQTHQEAVNTVTERRAAPPAG